MPTSKIGGDRYHKRALLCYDVTFFLMSNLSSFIILGKRVPWIYLALFSTIVLVKGIHHRFVQSVPARYYCYRTPTDVRPTPQLRCSYGLRMMCFSITNHRRSDINQEPSSHHLPAQKIRTIESLNLEYLPHSHFSTITPAPIGKFTNLQFATLIAGNPISIR